MTTSRVLWIAGCMLLAGCRDAAPQEHAAAHRVVAAIDGSGDASAAQKALTARLAEHRAIAIVFAHDDALAEGAAAACAAAQRSDVRIVGTATTGAGAQKLVADGKRAAVCVCPAATAAAIDVTLLACSGITVPKELGLGVTWVTAANAAAGGAHEAAPGDFVLDTARRQYADTLTTTPTIDIVFRIGLVDGGAALPGGAALRAELIAAAKRYPQLQLGVAPPAAGTEPKTEQTVEQQEAAARQFIAQNYNALLVVPGAPGALAKVCAEAAALDIKVVVLGTALGSDDFRCHVGADAGALGRAAAAAIKQLLPRGGDVVELKGNVPAAAATSHDELVRALGAKSP